MSINQKHIADALNLSVITVSRALRGHPDLSESTRERVLEKAQELGYRKISAQPIITPTARPRRVGVLLFDPQSPHTDPLASGVKRMIFLAIQKECQRLQVETLIETPSIDETPLLIKNQTVDGAFVFGRYTPETIERLGNLPILAVSSFIQCAGLPRIVADNFNGIRIVTEHLIELGHKKILFVGIKDSLTHIYEDRVYGYFSAMCRHGLAPQTMFCDSFKALPTNDDIRHFSAVVCSSDALAYAIQVQLLTNGFHLPEDCSIVSFDNIYTDSPYPITTYSPDWNMMGRMAADLLLSQPIDIRGQDLVVTVPGQLVIRNSACRYSKS